MSPQVPPGKVGVTPAEAFKRAVALQARRDLAGAEKIYRAILKQYPKHQETLTNLGTVLLGLERMEEALQFLRKALNQQPNAPMTHCLIAWALQMLDRNEEALERTRRAIALNPALPDAHATLARVLANLGRYEAAIRALSRAIDLAPEQARFYGYWGHMTRWTAGETRLAGLEALARKSTALSLEDQVEVQFALAKARADCGDIEASFRHQIAGGALQRKMFRYDEAANLRQLEEPRRALDAAWLARHMGDGDRGAGDRGAGDRGAGDRGNGDRGVGDPSPLPVFILGMPRSGTTLVEQILASHPQVTALGERLTFNEALARMCGTPTAPASIASRAAQWSDQELRRLGGLYVAAIRREAPGGTVRIIDKMPANFLSVGLIHAALPNACIIHTIRDPVDTCLSLFSILFSGYAQLYSYDLGELGRYYRGYEELMAHWRAMLPAGVMLDVHYEDVVDDLEGQARRIVGHCGLEWDDACLAFHRSARPVRTASHAQVRQPIYRTSVGRTRPPKALLQPLLDALGIG